MVHVPTSSGFPLNHHVNYINFTNAASHTILFIVLLLWSCSGHFSVLLFEWEDGWGIIERETVAQFCIKTDSLPPNTSCCAVQLHQTCNLSG